MSVTGGQEAAWLDLFALYGAGVVQPGPEWPAKDLDAVLALTNESRRVEAAE